MRSRVVIAIVFAVSMIAAHASAAGIVSYKSKTATTKPTFDNTVATVCPDTAYATGGGVKMSGSQKEGASLLAHYPVGLHNWQSSLLNGTQKKLDATFKSVCVTVGSGQVYSNSVSAPSGTNTSATVFCASPMETLIGGGAATGVGDKMFESFPIDGPDMGSVPDGWKASVYNPLAGSSSIIAFAICTLDTVGVSYPSASVDTDAYTQGSVTAHCESGEKVTAGGTEIFGGSPDNAIASSYPAKKGKGWTSKWYNASGGFDAVLESWAICLDVG